MSLSVEGQKCPVCKSYMFDDEEIVFCPVCGVPTHKECYDKIKKCPLEEYHGTDMQYTPPEINDEPIEIEEPKEENEIPFGFRRAIEIDLYGGIKKDDQIAGVTAEEMKKTVGPNSQYYIPRFFKLNNRNKKSWNWSAFIFPEGFFFFRKCHKMGILAALLTIASFVALTFANSYLNLANAATYSEIENLILNQLNANPDKVIFALIAMFVGFAIFVPSRILFGLFANWIYRNEVFEKVKVAKEQTEEDPEEVMQLKGGINPFLGLIGIMGVRFIVNLLVGIFVI